MVLASIRVRLIFSFVSLSVVAGLMAAAFFWFDSSERSARRTSDLLRALNLKMEQAGRVENIFYIDEIHNADFYETGNSQYLQRHRQLVQELLAGLQQLPGNDVALRSTTDSLKTDVALIGSHFDSLAALMRQRGFRNYGLEGEIQQAISRVVNSGYPLNLLALISIRKLEKDYLIHKNDAYLQLIDGYLDRLRAEAGATITDPIGRVFVQTSIEQYREGLANLNQIDKRIGLQNNTGLRGEIGRLSMRIEQQLTHIDQTIASQAEQLSQRVQMLQLGLLLLFVALVLLLGLALHRGISRPLQKLSGSVREVVASDFRRDKEIYQIDSRDELGRISADVQYLLDKFNERTDEVTRQREALAQAYEGLETLVEARTAEVMRQKQEIEQQNEELAQSFKNVKLLSEIGQIISGYLSVERIVEKVYASVNELMDADVFAIGVWQKERAQVSFIGAIENGQQLPPFAYDLNNKQSYAVQCIKQGRELHIADLLAQQANPLIQNQDDYSARSLIYLPLVGKDGVLGVITVQSFQPNAYTDYHLYILRNLAIYTATALENANAYKQIAEQHENIQRSNEKITASLNYASRIQAAMLPEWAEVQRHLTRSFVLFRPREVVSGDFYWFQEKKGKLFWAAVDCTGHGVPGAFMSMIGHDLLNEIVNEKQIDQADKILALMHLRVRQALKQETTQNRDGMDIALCIIDPAARQMEFAGAKSSLIFFQQGQQHQIKGDNSPIGGLQKEAERQFTSHRIALDSPTTFYLFTDGYKDQFGGPQGTKFTARAFGQLLAEIHPLPLEQQKEILEQKLEQWMGTNSQLDDILVMGAHL